MTTVKTDENLSTDAAHLLRTLGVDAQSVVDQRMDGWQDPDVWAVCCRERRALVTLDQDFGDQRVYPTGGTPGILLLRPSSQRLHDVLRLIQETLPGLLNGDVSGRLWVIIEQKVRIR